MSTNTNRVQVRCDSQIKNVVVGNSQRFQLSSLGCRQRERNEWKYPTYGYVIRESCSALMSSKNGYENHDSA